MAYTYQDFETAANAAGMMGSFNEADLKIAQNNPEYGLGMLGIYKDLAGAKTEEQKTLANAAAEQLRKTYSGVANPGYAATEGSTGIYSQALSDALNKVTNPTAFSYNAEGDSTYQDYARRYLREGERASQNVLGQAAAMTGGRPSSYAATAATQAGDYYAAQLADKVPELEQNAYQRYLAGLQLDQQRLAALQAQDNTEYQRYLQQKEIEQQTFSNALSMYQLLGDKAPEWVFTALNIAKPEEVSGGGGGGGYAPKAPAKNDEGTGGGLTVEQMYKGVVDSAKNYDSSAYASANQILKEAVSGGLISQDKANAMSAYASGMQRVQAAKANK